VRYGADCTVLAAHGGVATRWNRTSILPGLQAQLAGDQAGAPHAAQACPVPACKHSLQAFKPARGMPRKLAGFHPHCEVWELFLNLLDHFVARHSKRRPIPINIHFPQLPSRILVQVGIRITTQSRALASIW